MKFPDELEKRFITPDAAIAATISRIQQLDQVVAILGSSTPLGMQAVSARDVWSSAQKLLLSHLEHPSSCGNGVSCTVAFVAVRYLGVRNGAAEEVMLALLGITEVNASVLTDLLKSLAWIQRSGTGGEHA